MRKYFFAIILLSFSLLIGCAQAPLEITKYHPINSKAKKTASFMKNVPTYNVYDGKDYALFANIFEYNNIIVLFLSIKNKMNENIIPEDYSVALADGRDYKHIKMLTMEDMLKIKAKYIGASSSDIQDQMISTTVNSAMKVVNLPTKEQLIELMDKGIENYFSFRPIYKNETRDGILCFMPDFKLEFPLSIKITVNGQAHYFYYMVNSQ